MGRTLAIVVVLGMFGTAHAQRTCDPEKDKDCRGPKVVRPVAKPKAPKSTPVITIGPLSLIGTQRNALMMEFLERANEELSRGSLESRSFVPELVRSVDREAL